MRPPAQATPKAPVSWRFSIAKLPDSGHTEQFSALAEERTALAQENDLQAVEAFDVCFTIKHLGGDDIGVTGNLVADIVQTCVVTLEPLPVKVEVDFAARFVPQTAPLDADAEIVVDPEADDAPEPFTPPFIDLGALAAEHFVLALDPYPRAPDAQWATVGKAAIDADEPQSPFAALKALRDDDGTS